MSEAIQGFIWPAVIAIVGWLVAWGIRKLNLKAEVSDAIENFAQRGLDLARKKTTAESDGGKVITAKELSELRQEIWQLIKEEAKGPVLKMVVGLGEDYVKGWIGRILERKGIKPGSEIIPPKS